MSFTLRCDNCNREWSNAQMIQIDMVVCEICGQEGCESCIDLTACTKCGSSYCGDCESESGLCTMCADETEEE